MASLEHSHRVAQYESILSPASYKPIELYTFKQLCFRGVPDSPGHLRPLAWSILLNLVSPHDPAAWPVELERKRNEYYALLKELTERAASMPEPRRSEPLSPSDTWLDQIDKDCRRTQVTLAFFTQSVPPNPTSPLSPPNFSFSSHSRSNSMASSSNVSNAAVIDVESFDSPRIEPILSRRSLFERMERLNPSQGDTLRERPSIIPSSSSTSGPFGRPSSSLGSVGSRSGASTPVSPPGTRIQSERERDKVLHSALASVAGGATSAGKRESVSTVLSSSSRTSGSWTNSTSTRGSTATGVTEPSEAGDEQQGPEYSEEVDFNERGDEIHSRDPSVPTLSIQPPSRNTSLVQSSTRSRSRRQSLSSSASAPPSPSSRPASPFPPKSPSTPTPTTPQASSPSFTHFPRASGSALTTPDLHWESLSRILYVYASLNSIRYVQGMNELLCPLYYVFAHDPRPDQAAHAEADAFWAFTTLMGDVRDLFDRCLDGDVLGLGIGGLRGGEGTGMGFALRRFERRLREVTGENGLLDEFEAKGVKSGFYAFRWLSCLGAREFEMPDVIRIWDSLLSLLPSPDQIQHTRTESESASAKGWNASPTLDFMIDICCAMVLELRPQLEGQSFATVLTLLQRYQCGDVEKLLGEAWLLRETRRARAAMEEARKEEERGKVGTVGKAKNLADRLAAAAKKAATSSSPTVATPMVGKEGDRPPSPTGSVTSVASSSMQPATGRPGSSAASPASSWRSRFWTNRRPSEVSEAGSSSSWLHRRDSTALSVTSDGDFPVANFRDSISEAITPSPPPLPSKSPEPQQSSDLAPSQPGDGTLAVVDDDAETPTSPQPSQFANNTGAASTSTLLRKYADAFKSSDTAAAFSKASTNGMIAASLWKEQAQSRAQAAAGGAGSGNVTTLAERLAAVASRGGSGHGREGSGSTMGTTSPRMDDAPGAASVSSSAGWKLAWAGAARLVRPPSPADEPFLPPTSDDQEPTELPRERATAARPQVFMTGLGLSPSATAAAMAERDGTESVVSGTGTDTGSGMRRSTSNTGSAISPGSSAVKPLLLGSMGSSSAMARHKTNMSISSSSGTDSPPHLHSYGRGHSASSTTHSSREASIDLLTEFGGGAASANSFGKRSRPVSPSPAGTSSISYNRPDSVSPASRRTSQIYLDRKSPGRSPSSGHGRSASANVRSWVDQAASAQSSSDDEDGLKRTASGRRRAESSAALGAATRQSERDRLYGPRSASLLPTRPLEGGPSGVHGVRVASEGTLLPSRSATAMPTLSEPEFASSTDEEPEAGNGPASRPNVNGRGWTLSDPPVRRAGKSKPVLDKVGPTTILVEEPAALSEEPQTLTVPSDRRLASGAEEDDDDSGGEGVGQSMLLLSPVGAAHGDGESDNDDYTPRTELFPAGAGLPADVAGRRKSSGAAAAQRPALNGHPRQKSYTLVDEPFAEGFQSYDDAAEELAPPPVEEDPYAGGPDTIPFAPIASAAPVHDPYAGGPETIPFRPFSPARESVPPGTSSRPPRRSSLFPSALDAQLLAESNLSNLPPLPLSPVAPTSPVLEGGVRRQRRLTSKRPMRRSATAASMGLPDDVEEVVQEQDDGSELGAMGSSSASSSKRNTKRSSGIRMSVAVSGGSKSHSRRSSAHFSTASEEAYGSGTSYGVAE